MGLFVLIMLRGILRFYRHLMSAGSCEKIRIVLITER